MKLKKWSYILAMTLFASHLGAENYVQEHVQVETRPLTHTQRLAIMEERASESAYLPMKTETSVTGSADTSTLYSSVHPGAYHLAVDITFFGEQIATEDGAIWTIFPGDRYKTVQWSSFEDLVVIQNTDVFSNYLFSIVNLANSQIANANLVLGPLYNGPYTYWIKAINVDDRKVVLNDNSTWDMSRFDSSVYRMWFVNDTIIIGINDGSLNSFNPNILINVNTLTYARGSLD